MRFAVVILLFAATALGQTLFDPAITLSDSSLLNGLVSGYRLEEASGTRYDRSKNGNHLTSNNSVGQAAGKVGNCATFVSASSQSLSGATTDYTATGSIFINAWVKLTTKTANMAIASKYDTGGNTRKYLLYYDTAADRFTAIISTNGTGGSATATANNFGAVSTNVFYNVSMGYSSVSNTVTIAVNNGTPNSTSTGSNPIFSSSSPFVVGANANSGGFQNLMNGSIDEVYVWKRYLTPSEITRLYNSGSGTHYPWSHP